MSSEPQAADWQWRARESRAVVARDEPTTPKPGRMRAMPSVPAAKRPSAVQDEMHATVERARGAGHTWDAVADALGTTPEAARNRFGTAAKRNPAPDRDLYKTKWSDMTPEETASFRIYPKDQS